MIDNVIGNNQFPIRKEEYKAMQESNRYSFYLKYFNDFREVKKNVVGFRDIFSNYIHNHIYIHKHIFNHYHCSCNILL